MLLETISAGADSTIVEARDRFSRKQDTRPFDLDRGLVSLFEKLRYCGTQRDVDSHEVTPNANERVQDVNEGAPDYFGAIEMIHSAAELMSVMEAHVQKVEAKAYEITQCARTEVLAANDQLAALRQQMTEDEAVIADLQRRVLEAEEQAQNAQQWLLHMQEAILQAFSARINGASPALGGYGRPAA
jgi:hypothetical protein